MNCVLMSEFPDPPKATLLDDAEAEVLARLKDLGITGIEHMKTEIRLNLAGIEIKASFVFTPPSDLRERWAAVSHDHPELRWLAYQEPRTHGNTVVGELDINRAS